MSSARDTGICFISVGGAGGIFLLGRHTASSMQSFISGMIVGISVIRLVSCFSQVRSFLDFALACPSPGDVAGRMKYSK